MKFKLTKETRTYLGVKLFRIKAVASFGDVKIGDLGGWVEKESNLWVYGNAWVYGEAKVSGNAKVSGDAKVYDNAKVYGKAWVYGDAEVYGNVVFICGLKWRVTISDNYISIGCQTHTVSFWETAKDKTIEKMEDGALEWWKIHKPIIMGIVKGRKVD